MILQRIQLHIPVSDKNSFVVLAIDVLDCVPLNARSAWKLFYMLVLNSGIFFHLYVYADDVATSMLMQKPMNNQETYMDKASLPCGPAYALEDDMV